MNISEFNSNQKDYKRAVKEITKFLNSHINKDMRIYMYVCTVNNKIIANLIKKEYENKGWKVKLKKHVDYYNISDEIEIYFKI